MGFCSQWKMSVLETSGFQSVALLLLGLKSWIPIPMNLIHFVSMILMELGLAFFIGNRYKMAKMQAHEEAISLASEMDPLEQAPARTSQSGVSLIVVIVNVAYLALKYSDLHWDSLFAFLDASVISVLNTCIIHNGAFRKIDVNLSVLIYS